MTKDEIIDMAREAGSIDSEDVILTIYNAFASAEREACADLLEFGYIDEENHHLQYAYEIRARGEQA